MFTHYIILSSAYSCGERIAMDYTDVTLKLEKIISFLDKIKEECGVDVPVSFYSIDTTGKNWESVAKTDGFFKDVRLIESEDEFISLIKKDRELSGLDVAKYILTNKIEDCTHLKLEKLVYLCYADYLCKTEGSRLFIDNIYAYRYGPVIASVYEQYKFYGNHKIKEEAIDDDKIIPTRNYSLSARSRILFSKDGLLKIQSIEETLKKYGDYSGGQLIDLTHRKNTPWSHYDATKSNIIISDKDILKYHCNEV